MIADQHDGQQDEDDRVQQRRDGLASHRVDHLRIGDEAAQHGIEVAAALAGDQRRGVDPREEVGVGAEGVGQRRAAAHLLVHVVEHRLEDRVGQALAQDVERLHQRHAGLEQRRQLLVEDQELVPLDGAPPQRQPRHRAPRGQRQDVESLVLELATQGSLARRNVDALDDLPSRGAQPAAELHAGERPTTPPAGRRRGRPARRARGNRYRSPPARAPARRSGRRSGAARPSRRRPWPPALIGILCTAIASGLSGTVCST